MIEVPSRYFIGLTMSCVSTNRCFTPQRNLCFFVLFAQQYHLIGDKLNTRFIVTQSSSMKYGYHNIVNRRGFCERSLRTSLFICFMFFYFLVSENKPKNMFKNWKIQHAPWWCTWLDPQSLSFSEKQKQKTKNKTNKKTTEKSKQNKRNARK